jgi:hypothetical protein
MPSSRHRWRRIRSAWRVNKRRKDTDVARVPASTDSTTTRLMPTGGALSAWIVALPCGSDLGAQPLLLCS